MNSDRRSTSRQVAALLAFVLICFAAAGLGSLATASSVNDWYRTLERPTWSPPNWVFGPVWTALYLMMAVAAWLIWRQGGWSAAVRPLSWFGAQLALNVLWSLLFFGMQSPGLAFAEVLLLWLAIAGTIASFWPRSRLAALLLAPYLAWTSFAAVLNFVLWRLNA